MLRSWSVANFKSVGETQTLQLAPLTVIAGANNSGKSALLQSILLLAQTLRGPVDEPALALDGELFRGGEADEAIHFGQQTMSLGFEADVDLIGTGALAPSEGCIRGEIAFRLSGRTPAERRFVVSHLSLAVLDSEGQQVSTLAAARRSRGWAGKLGSAPPAWLRPNSLDYKAVGHGDRYPQATAVSLYHVFPQWVVTRRDARYGRYRDLTRYILWRRSPVREDPSLVEDSLVLARAVLQDPELKSLDALTRQQRKKLQQELQRVGLQAAVPRAAIPVLERFKGDYRWVRQALEPPLENGIASFLTLARGVRHVGPLRIPPRFLYAPAPYVEENAVGSAGEFTVAELHRNRSVEVDSVNPQSGAPERVRLEVAVVRWLSHMGILDRILTDRAPKIGHYLYVMPPDLRRFVDLTSVGVGASQVLPVLVQSLIAPPRSILIFEQPELHLHPRLQGILADFLLGIAKTGKQLLVETHSEHIINRIRLRIAEAENSDIQSRVRVYFAERHGGESHFRPISINDYGTFEDWPEGFFDETVLESEQILRSSLRKRSSNPK